MVTRTLCSRFISLCTARFIALLLLLVASLAFPGFAFADPSKPAPTFSYTACSTITAEHLTALQLYQRGVTLEDALENLPRVSRSAEQRLQYIYDLIAQQGVLNTYSDINTNYARCATLVHREHGKPAIDQREYGYYYCAGENRIRFEIILTIDRFHTLEKVLDSTPESHHRTAVQYFNLTNAQGVLAAFDLTANNLKACLNNLAF